MLNSNFDLRTFLAESKAPKEQIEEAILTEATVMEYIREKMGSMNNEVRSCMREYLERCNEIDMEHEDAHTQLMNALEDFYNKLKAHFEEDAADEDPMPGDEEAPTVLPNDVPAIKLEEEEVFGDEKDALEEVKVKITPPEGEPYLALDGKEMSKDQAEDFIENSKNVRGMTKAEIVDDEAEVLSADEIQARIDQEAKTNTVIDILGDAAIEGTIDLRNATPEQVKMFVSIARDSDGGGDEVTGDTYMHYLEKLPNYNKVAEANLDPRLVDGDEVFTATPAQQLKEDIYVDFANHISNTLSISLENAKLIAGLVKIVINAGSIPAALTLLYKNKDKGIIRKMFNTKFAKSVKSAMVGDDTEA